MPYYSLPPSTSTWKKKIFPVAAATFLIFFGTVLLPITSLSVRNPPPVARPTAIHFDPLHLEEEGPVRAAFDPLNLQDDAEGAGLAPQVRHGSKVLQDEPNPQKAVPWEALVAPLLAVAMVLGLLRLPRWGMAATSGETDPFRTPLGEDAAVFDLQSQRLADWVKFGAVFIAVMGGLFVTWVYPPTGLADEFVRSLEALMGGNSEATMLLILLIFGVAHSGLAGLRNQGEELIGARAYRVLFGLVSLPLALVAIVYFMNHRYDGVQLWSFRGVPGVHSFVWITTFISFFFLYPSTFNLLEVAAVDQPKVHLWETGIMRITRHPQMVGQLLWCMAHTLWIGNTFAIVTSAGLMAHHLFGCWHGDRRLAAKYGPAFEEVKARTSVWPFVAILEGRQTLPPDYWREFARAPYLAITIGTVAAYLAHPLMQSSSYSLPW